MTERGSPDLMAVVDRRGDVLRALDDGPHEKHRLEGRLDVSRSTIDRGIRELEALDLIERSDDGYGRTLPGDLALAEYEQFSERMAGLVEGAGLLAAVDPAAEVDPAMLAGSRIVQADMTAPERPSEVLYGIVERSTAVRGFAPSVHPQQVETYSEQLLDGSLSADLVLTEGVLDRLLADYTEEFGAAGELDRLRLWETPRSLPYSLTIGETEDGPRAVLMVYADRGIEGCIVSDTEEAVAWAERRFEREREAATRVT